MGLCTVAWSMTFLGVVLQIRRGITLVDISRISLILRPVLQSHHDCGEDCSNKRENYCKLFVIHFFPSLPILAVHTNVACFPSTGIGSLRELVRLPIPAPGTKNIYLRFSFVNELVIQTHFPRYADMNFHHKIPRLVSLGRVALSG